METGTGTRVSIEENSQAPRAGLPQRRITEHVLRIADQAGYRAALIDAADGTVTPWPRFAQTVRAAARGLRRRGLTPDDTVGVLVRDAARHAIAVHTIREAGAIAVPIRLEPGTDETADIAAQLKACGARLMITVDELAELASQAADRSWVRQVLAFGETAEATGATPFSSLLEVAKHGQAAGNVTPHDRTELTPADALEPAAIDYPGGLSARLTGRDVVVAGPPGGSGSAYTALLDFALMSGSTVVAASAGDIALAVRRYRGTAAIVSRGVDVPVIPAARVFLVD